jgi:hypothetical protein
MNDTSNPQVAIEKARDTYRKTAAQFEELTRDAEVPEAMRDLSAHEIDALYEQLHRKGQRSIYISCNRAECSALANSFDQLFKRLGWPSTIGDGGILALGATGIQVNPGDDTARLLKSAIEARTKIKVDLSGIPRQAGDLNPTMLVIGTKPTEVKL